MHIRKKKRTGIHVRAKSDMNCPKSKAASIQSPIGRRPWNLKLRQHLVDRGEADARLTPPGGAPCGAALVQAPRGFLEECDAAAAREQAANRRVVADIRRDSEEHDLLGI